MVSWSLHSLAAGSADGGECKAESMWVSGVSTVCAGARRGRGVNACLSAQLFPRSKTMLLLRLLLLL